MTEEVSSFQINLPSSVDSRLLVSLFHHSLESSLKLYLLNPTLPITVKLSKKPLDKLRLNFYKFHLKHSETYT
jgi:hypothetical protein